MQVESWIQANTMIVGWKMYDLLWSLLIATGIVFIPIILILAQTFVKARSRGAMSNISSEGILAEFEMKLFVLFLVFFFGAMPASVDLQAANSISLWNDQNDYLAQPSQPANSTACNTGSTGDANVNAPVTGGQSICTDNVRIPLWWYITQSVSQGLTMAVIKEVATQNNNLYRATRKFLAMSNIKDPDNKTLLNILENECRVQAVAKHVETGALGTVVAGDEGVDLNYVGSEYLRVTYYDSLNTQSVVPGLPPAPAFSGDVQPEYQTTAVSTQQNCNVLWTAFRAAVVTEATENLNWIDRLLTTGLGVVNRDDEIVRTYTLQTRTSQSLTTETASQLKDAGGSVLSKNLNNVEDHFQVYELMKTAFTTGMYVDVLIVGLPMLQAYILMLVVMALPFGFVISGYSFNFLLQGTILIFTISFWPALWALVSWADQVLADQFFAGGDGLLRATGQLAMDYVFTGTNTAQTLENITTVLTHNLVVASLYVLSPMVFSWVMAAASAGVAANIGSAASGGGLRGAVTGRSVGAAMGGATKLARKVK